MHGLFLPKGAEKLHVYLLPVRLNASIDALRRLIVETLDAHVDPRAAYLFVNKARDGVTVFWGDDNGSLTTQKRFAQGAIVLPELHADGRPWATLGVDHIEVLFR
jgi:hypothetical protein